MGRVPLLRWKVWNMCREYFTIMLNVSGCFFKKGKEEKKRVLIFVLLRIVHVGTNVFISMTF